MRFRISSVSCVAAILILLACLSAWSEEKGQPSDKKQEPRLTDAQRLLRRPPDPTTDFKAPRKGFSTSVLIGQPFLAYDARIGYQPYGTYQTYNSWWYYNPNPFGLLAPDVDFNRGYGRELQLQDLNQYVSRRYDSSPVIRPAADLPARHEYPSQSVQKKEYPDARAVSVTLTGEVVRLISSSKGDRIVVRSGGKEESYDVVSDAVIVRGVLNNRGVEVGLPQIRVGDQVSIRVDENSSVVSLRAQYKAVSGKVKAVANGTVLLESGETFRVIDTTPVYLSAGGKGKSADIQEHSKVRAELSPVSGRVYSVVVDNDPAPDEAESAAP